MRSTLAQNVYANETHSTLHARKHKSLWSYRTLEHDWRAANDWTRRKVKPPSLYGAKEGTSIAEYKAHGTNGETVETVELKQAYRAFYFGFYGACSEIE